MQQSIDGTVERVVYANAESGYTVLRMLPAEQEQQQQVTVIGHLPAVSPGERLRIYGDWSVHRRHGRQFRAERYERLRPSTADAIERYLGSGLIKGIGPVTARRIVATFGEKTLDVIERHPEWLAGVAGLGPSKVELISSAWKEQRSFNDILALLERHGIGSSLAVRIFKHYGDQTMDVLEKRPYHLVRDIQGMSFATADQIDTQLLSSRTWHVRARAESGGMPRANGARYP